MTCGDGWRRTAALTFALLMVTSVIIPVAGTHNTNAEAQLSATGGQLSGADSSFPDSSWNQTNATAKQNQDLALRLASNLSSEKQGIQNNLNRAQDRLNKSLQHFDGEIRVNESQAFTHDAVGVRALAHATRTDDSTRAQRVADLIYQADNATASTTVEDARRVLDRYGDDMNKRGLRISAEEHLKNAERALERGQDIARNSEGRKYFSQRARAITSFRQAHRHARLTIRFVDRNISPRVRVKEPGDPIWNGSGNRTYTIGGNVSAAQPSQVENVTISINSNRTVEASTTISTTAPGRNASYQSNVSVSNRVNRIVISVRETESERENDRQHENDEKVERKTEILLDGDGLPASYERTVTKTDPLNFDSNSDLTSANESNNGIVDGREDLDGDNLSNQKEYAFGGDPNKKDTDGDGLPDKYELMKSDTYVFLNDSDDDGVSDGNEDTDGDGLTNLEELSLGTDPLSVDTDRDDLNDSRETSIGTNATKPDTDNDGLEDGEEILLGTDPLNPDTNQNGILDGNETYTTTKQSTAFDVNITATGTGHIASGIEVDNHSESEINRSLVSDTAATSVIDLSSEKEFENADLTFGYDESEAPENESALIAVRYNESIQGFEPLPTEVDTANNTVSTETDHFSTFAIFKIPKWKEVLQAQVPKDGSSGGVNASVDVLFIIDSSGSMGGNDPSGFRKTAAKEFVGALIEGDRAGVVDFDGNADLAQPLTVDFGEVNATIESLDSFGGTDIGSGVQRANEHFKEASNDSRAQYAVLLTDGQGSGGIAEAETAAQRDTTIYTIGFGNANGNKLQEVADITGGNYSNVDDASELPEVFSRVAEDVNPTDSDGDGLSDKMESEGIPVSPFVAHGLDNGHVDLEKGISVVKTNPNKADTDGDSLSDKEELGKFVKQPVSPFTSIPRTGYYTIQSDPSDPNSDDQGLSDSKELEKGSDPMEAEVVTAGYHIPVLTNPEASARSQPATVNELEVCCGMERIFNDRGRGNFLVYDAKSSRPKKSGLRTSNRIIQKVDVMVYASANDAAMENLDLSSFKADIRADGIIYEKQNAQTYTRYPTYSEIGPNGAKRIPITVSIPQHVIEGGTENPPQKAMNLKLDVDGLQQSALGRETSTDRSMKLAAVGGYLLENTQQTLKDVRTTYDEGVAVATAAEAGVAKARARGGGVRKAARYIIYEYTKGEIKSHLHLSSSEDLVLKATNDGIAAFEQRIERYQGDALDVDIRLAGPTILRAN